MGLLDQRGIVITGAGRGLGRCYALAVAREGAGVVVNDIDVKEAQAVVAEIEREGGTAIASGASVAGWESAGELIETCVREFGRLDGLVNNAVAYSYFGPPWEEQGDTIKTQIDVNVTGALYCAAHALRRMVAQRSGSLINIASRGIMGQSGMAVYSASKGALASATYAQAMDVMEHNVRVNAFCPAGFTRGHTLAGQNAEYARSIAAPPELVAPGIVYLLSDLSDGVTGQLLVLLGHKLGLMRRPEMLEHIEQRDEWTAQEIADLVEREFRRDFQPVGITASGPYAWQPAVSPASL
jgi:NAD(P)-dependent dehydrogenase (short-subunit alcohol dehydrogenase family)